MKPPTFAFFGTPDFATAVLDELARARLLPALILCAPDVRASRGLALTAPPAKTWAEEQGNPILLPTSLTNEDELAPLLNTQWDLFLVAAYGKLLPPEILALPRSGVLNVHPSLLPRLRGPAPVAAAILADEPQTGVSIMLMDEEMDHGPIVAQARIEIEKDDWPVRASVLEVLLAHAGGELLAETLPLWLAGKITPEEQDHAQATYTQKITTADGRIDLAKDPYQNLLKIRAYDSGPGAFFLHKRNNKHIRVKITDARLAADGSLEILRVIPEGKKEMDYQDFLRG